ncbi:MAG: fimbrial protein, partial [Pantoea sp.]|uniref:fimbrial protein n=1 Tax=Pantoea sp. TaxID=69393 RepID=UPI0039E5233F
VSGGDAGGAVASGVAIYLRDAEDKLVPLNSDQSTRYALTPGTDNALIFSAQYVATQDHPTAGTADGEVTLRFDYL